EGGFEKRGSAGSRRRFRFSMSTCILGACAKRRRGRSRAHGAALSRAAWEPAECGACLLEPRMSDGAATGGAASGANKLNLGVFISYSRDDLEFADQLDAALAKFGFSTTLDRREVAGGEDWKNRLVNLIRDADTVVFVLSPSSVGSPECREELETASRLAKRIVPIA